MNHRKHKVGDTFCKLTITEAYFEKRNVWMHKVVCSCGKELLADGGEMSRGNKKSCGCYRKERSRTYRTHGMTKSPEYSVWATMMQRCNNPNDDAFHSYGGRGIRVCQRWRKFERFIEDMGKRPSRKSTLERVDNDKGYSPENCIWASRSAQSTNQRIRKDNKTGVCGVSFSKGSFISNINKDGKRIYLGSFTNLQDAAEARADAEIKYHK